MIRKMKDSDWESVAAIYSQGMETGISTFTTECPSFQEWDRSHSKDCRLVYEKDGAVVGWVAVSPTSARRAYRGSVEMSIYVDNAFQRKGIGTALVSELFKEAPQAGFWSVYSVIISRNESSIALHRKCGFREIGYRERVAQDRFGNWQNTTLMEYRLPDV